MSPNPVEPIRPGKPVKPIPGKPIREPLPTPRTTYWRAALNFRIDHRHFEREETTTALSERPRGGGYFISALSSQETSVILYLDLCLPPNVTIKRIEFPYKTEGNNSIDEIYLTIYGDGSYAAISINNANLRSSSGSTFRSEEIHSAFDGAAILRLKTSLRGHGDSTSIQNVKIIVEEG